MNSVDCRSVLYMPASRERVLVKGARSAADALIIDLEDAVAPQVKAAARETAQHALEEIDFGHRRCALRVNAADTSWHDGDLQLAARSLPDALVLPKVESAGDIIRLSAAMDQLGIPENMQIWAMMESPHAIIDAAGIAASVHDCPRLTMLIAGVNDLVRESGLPMSKDRSMLIPWLMQLVAAARAHGLQIVDGVFNDFSDAPGLESECRQGVSMGMDGKSLIHPAQIAMANELFSPSMQDIEAARAIVSAFDEPANAGAGVLQVQGRMVERLHLEMARALLLRAERLAERT